MQIKKQKQQLRDIKAGRLLPPGQNLEEEDEEEDEEELEEVKEFEPTDRRPTIFDTEKGESYIQCKARYSFDESHSEEAPWFSRKSCTD